jgi:hypothetical protein
MYWAMYILADFEDHWAFFSQKYLVTLAFAVAAAFP